MKTRFIPLCLLISTPVMADDAPSDSLNPNVSQEAIYRALAVRDPVPSCETIETMSPTPLADLLYVIDHATQPPWVAMRAAQCILRRHGEDAQPQIARWVRSEETRGLALMTFSLLDQMPLELATPIAEAALQGPLAEDAQERLGRADSPELRALVR